ncbi:MAG TPA: GAF and ANTAR domain-containing protein [Mycobacteriales bacterium]|nr:GAF and ANTAR domain-containing protein [Mycobacteriales bacterium]
MTIEHAGTRMDEMADAITELAQLLVDDVDLQGMLQRVADLAARTIPDCDSAGVTLMERGRPTTAAATDERTLAVDEAQYAAGDGPCLHAYRTCSVQRVASGSAQVRFPAFAEAARRAGIKSFLAAPLVVRGEGIGSLNLYSEDDHGFAAVDEAVVQLFAAQGSVAVANARLYHRATTVSHQLGEAMTSRAVIEQAKGVLMATWSLGPDDAFDVLRRASQHENRKLRELAAEVVAAAQAGRPLDLRLGA